MTTLAMTAKEEIQAPRQTDLLEMMLRAARDENVSLERMLQIYELMERMEEAAAKRAFVAAMSDFKAEDIHIIKDKVNQQYNSRYSSIENLVTTVTPYLSKHGLTADWEIDQTTGIKVTCVITHSLGYSKRVNLQVPVDTSGAKNPLQQIKSSITYARICTFECAIGLASESANLNDDGNGAGKKATMPEPELLDHMNYIDAASCVPDLQKFYVDALDSAKKYGDNDAVRAFGQAKNKKYRELVK